MMTFLDECWKQFTDLAIAEKAAALLIAGLLIPTLWQGLVALLKVFFIRVLREPSWQTRVYRSLAGELFLFHQPLVPVTGGPKIVASRLEVQRRWYQRRPRVRQRHISTGRAFFNGELHADAKNVYIRLDGTHDTDHKMIVLHVPADHSGTWAATGTMCGITDLREPYAVRVILTRAAYRPEVTADVLGAAGPLIARYSNRDALHQHDEVVAGRGVGDPSAYIPSLSDAMAQKPGLPATTPPGKIA